MSENKRTSGSFIIDKWETEDLVLKNVTKTFKDNYRGTIHAVNDVSFSIRKGSFVTLLGPSACGKTTTLRIIAGFEQPDSGEIFLGTGNIGNIPAYDRDMPMVFQSYALFPHLTVFENIAYGLRIRKLKKEIIKNDVEMALQDINLAGLENSYPGELSGGQQQRVALARAIVLKPKIILFDEPLSNLDAKLRIQTRLEIKRIQHKFGITMLWVTHDQAEALSLSDIIILMNKGKIEQIGTPEEIYNKPESVFVADFIGNSNFIDTVVKKIDKDFVSVDVEGKVMEIPRNNVFHDIRPGEEVYLSIKPESVNIGKKNTGFAGKITNRSFLGSTVEYGIEFKDSYITSIQPNSARRRTYVPAVNESVYIDLDENFIQILKKE